MKINSFSYLLSLVGLSMLLVPARMLAISKLGKNGGSGSCRVHLAHDRAVIEVELRSIEKVLQDLHLEQQAKVIELEKLTQVNGSPEALEKLAHEMHVLASKIQIKVDRRNELRYQIIRHMIRLPRRGPLTK